MTVCIAAICESEMIVGASDRMMTSGDVEFEPRQEVFQKKEGYIQDVSFSPNTKIFRISKSVVALTAGDAGLQSEILQDVNYTLSHKNMVKPTWLPVKEAVDTYVECYNKAKSKRAKSAVFASFGLDEISFLKNQQQMSKEFVLEIYNQIRNFDVQFASMHAVETIITGIDDDSVMGRPIPHIYVVIKKQNFDDVICQDPVGFAAIGSGSYHASGQFMQAGHSRYSPMQETLFLTYLAKKRSEIAPGVGKNTDMFTIGPELGSHANLDNISGFDMKRIHDIYEKFEGEQRNMFESAKKKTK